MKQAFIEQVMHVTLETARHKHHRDVFSIIQLLKYKTFCVKTQKFTFYLLLNCMAFTQAALRAELKVRGQCQGSSDSGGHDSDEYRGFILCLLMLAIFTLWPPTSKYTHLQLRQTSLMLNGTIMTKGCS